MSSNMELLIALEELKKQMHAHFKLDVRKHFSLLLADAQASTAIFNARCAMTGGESNED